MLDALAVEERGPEEGSGDRETRPQAALLTIASNAGLTFPFIVNKIMEAEDERPDSTRPTRHGQHDH